METKYKLIVKNESKNYGNICVFQTMPDRTEDMQSLAWSVKSAHPSTVTEFDWTVEAGHNAWSGQRPDANSHPYDFMSANAMCMEAEDCDNRFKPHPRYWVAFGNFEESDLMDASVLENAVELKPEDMGKTVIINEDNSISIE